MELPIAKQSYLPTADALVRAVKRADVVLARTTAQEETLDGATVFANPSRPTVALANFATDLTIPQGGTAQAVVEAIAAWFGQQGTVCTAMDCAGMAWPADLAGALEARGWRPLIHHVFRMDGYVPPTRTNPDLQIIPARAAYGELRRLFLVAARQEYAAENEQQANSIADVLIDQLDEQRLEYYLARIDGQPVGYGGVVGLGQTGVIHAAFTDPGHRGKGIGGTLPMRLMCWIIADDRSTSMCCSTGWIVAGRCRFTKAWGLSRWRTMCAIGRRGRPGEGLDERTENDGISACAHLDLGGAGSGFARAGDQPVHALSFPGRGRDRTRVRR